MPPVHGGRVGRSATFPGRGNTVIHDGDVGVIIMHAYGVRGLCT